MSASIWSTGGSFVSLDLSSTKAEDGVTTALTVAPSRVLRRLRHRMLTHERRSLIVLSGAVAVLVVLMTLVDGVRASSARAESQTARGLNAGRDYSMTAVPGSPAAAALETSNALQLASLNGTLGTSQSRLDMPVVVGSNSTAFQAYGESLRLINDTSTTSGDPVALSAAAAMALNVDLGDTVTVTFGDQQQAGTVLRIFSLPALPEMATAVIAADAAPPGAALRWVANQEDLDREPLAGALESGTGLQLRSTLAAATESMDLLDTGRLAPLRFAAPALVLLACMLWAALTAALLPSWRRHLQGLEAVGLDQAQRQSILSGALTTSALLGVGAGAVVGVGIVLGGYTYLGRIVDHEWTGGIQSIGRLLGFLAAIALVTTCINLLLVRPRRPRSQAAATTTRRWLTIASAATVVLGLLLAGLAFASLDDPRYLVMMFYAGTLICIGAPQLLHVAATRRRPHRLAVARGTQIIRTTLVLPAVVVAVATFAPAFATTVTETSINLNRALHIPDQPAGSVLIGGVDEGTQDLIASVWYDAGGRTEPLALQTPDEQQQQLRVSSPDWVECLKQSAALRLSDPMAMACELPRDTMSPLNSVALDTEGDGSRTSDALPVDPGLIQDERAGFVVLTDGDRIDGIFTAAATPDPLLGGQLPGAIARPDQIDAVALEPSGAATIVLLAADQLNDDQRDRLVPALSAAAPTSPIIADEGFGDSGRVAWAWFTALFGAGLTACLVLVTLTVTATAASTLRHALYDLGAPWQLRLCITLAIVSPLAGGIVAAAVLAWGFGALTSGPIASGGNLMWLPSAAATLAGVFGVRRLVGNR